MPFFKSLSARLGSFLALYGGWGLLAISFLDSSFLSFPLVNDLLLIHLSSQHPAMALIYALQCTLGSVLGACVMYAAARSGAKFLWRRTPAARMARIERWVERNDFVAILVISLLPPPAPFKLFAIAAGALRVNALRFGAALLVGRGLRFAAEGLLGARFGAAAEAYVMKNIGWVSIVTIVLVVALTLITRWLRGRAAQGTGGEAGSGPPGPH